jgi:hypothetical protein
MKDFSTRSTTSSQGDTRNISQTRNIPQRGPEAPSYLTTRPHQEQNFIRLWYRLASPPEPGSSASFKEMERFRRGRAGSNLILALYLLLIVSIPTQFVGTASYLVPIAIGAALALAVGIIFNRMGKVYLAGTIVTLTFIGFPILDIITTPGGLSMLVLPLYGLLVLSLLCVVSFLPPWWVFVVALGNSLFTCVSLISSYLPHTAELSAVLAIASAGIIIPIVLSQILVSVVAYAWVQGNTQSLIRADRAEELARLEHDLGLQAEATAQQKQLLEASIQKIVETHTRVANGDFGARVPLTRDNVLWQISGSLNNILARVQSLHQDAIELQRLRFVLEQAREENRRLVRALGKGVN